MLAAVLVAIAARGARADEDRAGKDAELVWRVRGPAAQCAEPHALVAVVEERVGRPVFGLTKTPSLVVTVNLTSREGSWEGSVSVHDTTDPSNDAERRLPYSYGSCSDLRAVLVDAMVIAVDPDPRKRRELQSAPPEPRAWRAAIGVGAIGMGGDVPAPSFGGVVRGAWQNAQVPRLELTVGATAARRERQGDAAADFSTVLVELAACPIVLGNTDARASVRVCLGAAVDHVRATNRGTLPVREGARWSPRLDAGIAASLGLGAGFAATLTLRADVAPRRTRWSYADDDARTFWRAALLGGSAIVAVERALP